MEIFKLVKPNVELGTKLSCSKFQANSHTHTRTQKAQIIVSLNAVADCFDCCSLDCSFLPSVRMLYRKYNGRREKGKECERERANERVCVYINCEINKNP